MNAGFATLRKAEEAILMDAIVRCGDCVYRRDLYGLLIFQAREKERRCLSALESKIKKKLKLNTVDEKESLEEQQQKNNCIFFFNCDLST